MIIGDFFRWLTGTKRCNTKEKLLRYMKGKDLGALQHWTQGRMWYEKDGSKPWRQNWTPIEEVLARDVPGEDIETDCEEFSIVKKFVINGLWWGVAENLVVWADNDTMGFGDDKRVWCHASCLAWMKEGSLKLVDYSTYSVATVEEAVQRMGQIYKVRPTRYCFCSDRGVRVSEIFYFKGTTK